MKQKTQLLFLTLIVSILFHSSTSAAESGPAGAGAGLHPESERISLHSVDRCIEGQAEIIRYLQSLETALGKPNPDEPASDIEIETRLEGIKSIHALSRDTCIIQRTLISDLSLYPFIAGYLSLKKRMLLKIIPAEVFFAAFQACALLYHKSLPASAQLQEQIALLEILFSKRVNFFAQLNAAEEAKNAADIKTDFQAFNKPLTIWIQLLEIITTDLEDLRILYSVLIAPPALTAPAKESTEHTHPEKKIITPPLILEHLKEIITTYFVEKHNAAHTPASRQMLSIASNIVSRMSLETFSAHLSDGQHNLLAHAQEYVRCGQDLYEAKRNILTVAQNDIELSDKELTPYVQRLVSALSCDLLYSLLQDPKTTQDYRAQLRATFLIKPGIEWHQDIVSAKEIPATLLRDPKTEENSHAIMAMVKRWTLHHIIQFCKTAIERASLSNEELCAMDKYLRTDIFPKTTYTFTDSQRGALLHSIDRYKQIDHIAAIKHKILKKEAGYTSILLTDLFDQIITRYLLDIFESPHITIHLIKAIQKNYIASPQQPKKTTRHRRK
jgi:hypothetical protein